MRATDKNKNQTKQNGAGQDGTERDGTARLHSGGTKTLNIEEEGGERGGGGGGGWDTFEIETKIDKNRQNETKQKKQKQCERQTECIYCMTHV